MYGKLVAGVLQLPSIYPSKKSDEELIAEGYKLVVYDEQEEQREGYSANPVYTETETEIHVSFEYTPIPELDEPNAE